MNSSHPDFHIGVSKSIFKRSESCAMAHSIRAMILEFNQRQIGLNVTIKPADAKLLKIGSSPARKAPISLLFTLHYPGQIVPHARGLVHATMQINKDANKPLARLCIAHELFHLYQQLMQFEASKFLIWPTTSTHPSHFSEDQCDTFAWHLCNRHNKFYYDAKKLASCRFGVETFNRGPIKTSEEAIENWPAPFKLDPAEPFTLQLLDED